MSVLFFIALIWGLLWFRIARAAMTGREDFRVGGDDNPYMLRWWIVPRNKYFNVYLHHFLHDDDDRALHDHPWWSVSFTLCGELREVRHGENWSETFHEVRRGWPVFRSAKMTHRLEVVSGPAWTLFITGPVVRLWGFWCVTDAPHPNAFPSKRSYTFPRRARFVPWNEFVAPDDKGAVGRGCGEQ